MPIMRPRESFIEHELHCFLSPDPGACPSNRRVRAHGACTASARREEEAISLHIVDDEQRRDRRATPLRPSGSGPFYYSDRLLA
jgi:hypothetical protein